MTRIPWDQLPDGALQAVQQQLGGQFTAVDVEHAAASGVAAVLHQASGRLVFVKGQRDAHTTTSTPSEDDGSWWGPSWSPVDELDLEQAINPYTPGSSPRVLWRLDTDGWHLLGVEGLEGRDADYAPGSPDLAPVVAVLAELGQIPAPGSPRIPTAWDRWGYYCLPGDQERLAGNCLLHTDPASTNVVMHDGRAHLVDWSWPAAGPRWVDTALWGMRLISTGGHTPDQAWSWASRVPGWTEADPRAVATLVRAEARRWHDLADEQVPSAAAIGEAARVWAEYIVARGT
ncbi:aminoglycoside phosphotransferase [Streptomyces sp. MBT27]|uniref:aminoglycoside phosphotransferase n=1 Tax=Streptomyces sp. MBT27 TaxID=1488356 RepID=UPI001F0800F4|nr:aminoglycoside phosphotransferase [Streptomyces sp. MBT27]